FFFSPFSSLMSHHLTLVPFLLYYSSPPLLHLLSFPTRRSSDLHGYLLIKPLLFSCLLFHGQILMLSFTLVLPVYSALLYLKSQRNKTNPTLFTNCNRFIFYNF